MIKLGPEQIFLWEWLIVWKHTVTLTQDIFAKLNSGKVFSKLDLSEAYLQNPADE